MTSFTQSVYALVARIPAGRVATYGEIAARAGSPGAARAVGSDGSLHGYAFGGIGVKESKLRAEGVVIRNGKVDLTASRWRPTTSS